MAFFDSIASQVERIRVESAFSPPVELERPFQPGPPNPYLQHLKPKITITFAGHPVVMAPYGEPDPQSWPRTRGLLIIGGIAVAGLLAAAYLRRLR